MKINKITIPELQMNELRDHLINYDDKEALSFGLCRVIRRGVGHYLILTKVINIPYDSCERSERSISWSSRVLFDIVKEAQEANLSILKIHSHPENARYFSSIDDESDKKLFPKLYELTSSDCVHGSMIVTKDFQALARAVDENGEFFSVPKVVTVGDDIKVHFYGPDFLKEKGFQKRVSQMFGAHTTSVLSNLKVGVIGASGTGSPTITQLERNGVGELVIVDPKVSKRENLNRISQLRKRDVETGRYKVEVIAEDIINNELGCKVTPIPDDIMSEKAILVLSTCDVLFGCMDSALGRHIANKISSYYCIPLIDMGIQLKADGKGGIQSAWGSYHYIKPMGESLLSKKVYTMADVDSELIKLTDPKHFEELEKNKYIKRAEESAPAVISFNMRISSDAVIDLLARLHTFRDEDNSFFNEFRYNFCEGEVYKKRSDAVCPVFRRYVGVGDTNPLLGLTDVINRKIHKEFNCASH